MSEVNKEEIDRLLEDTKKYLETGETLVLGSALQVNNLSIKYGHFFNAAAVEAMERKATTLNLIENGEITGKTLYFSVRTASDKILMAAQKMSKIFNSLADCNKIVKTLAPLSSINLHTETTEQLVSVFFFVQARHDDAKGIESLYEYYLTSNTNPKGNRIDLESED